MQNNKFSPLLLPRGILTFAKVSSAIKFKITTGELPQGCVLGYGYTSTLPKATVWLRHHLQLLSST